MILIGGATQHRAIDSSTRELAQLLAAGGFTAVEYDRRGRGRSGDTAPWALEREVEDVAALVAAVGGPAALYSSSSGATIALAAATGGVDVDALVLYEPPFFPGAGHGKDLIELGALLAAGRNDDAMRYNLGTIMRMPSEAVDGMSGTPWWPAMVAVAPTLMYDLGALHDIDVDPDWAGRWAGMTVPTLVLAGDQTFPGLADAADAVAAALPFASRHVLPGQGHGPAPEAISPILCDFLSTTHR